MHLAQKTIDVFKKKGIEITREEEQGLLIAMLLHDIGHGPFSHALELSIINTSHEQISMMFIEQLNLEFDGKLTIAIEILKKKYKKPFLCQLVSGQIDLDRLDYLKRDSFYTGIPEGSIHQDRIISMMHVHNGKMVFEKKAIYSIESFLLARRFMYWQVYYHKINLLAEHLLVNILKRAKDIFALGRLDTENKRLEYFLNRKPFVKKDTDTVKAFSELDDMDIFGSVKSWRYSNDKVLSTLSQMLVNRELPTVEILDEMPYSKDMDSLKKMTAEKYFISLEEADYFVFIGKIENLTYDKNNECLKLHTYLHITDDSHTLYGFFDKAERQIFKLLISVSGVGTATARTMLSSMHPTKIKQAIINDDTRSITTVKGIGLKTAKRIVIDLRDKMLKQFPDDLQPEHSHPNKLEALSALEVLGFLPKQSEKVVDSILKGGENISVEELIKRALKRL
ncbi:Holliday junction ATP-dependent DNA helicase RuvA [Elysia marginata]|uniref:Holliday junction ATP-dependent DNA helicase RuvA n=1 Tax=Elysia marginata TaxID=1093978 RepID=A0AAV4FT86_9GAST|nr:Holliday junction ATP-dependent DNA helicase RuvA [Elysia marginata]